MKKVNLIFLLSLFSLSLISAYTRVGSSFNNLSFDNFFRSFDTSLLILAIVFLGLFWALNKATQKSGLIKNNGARVTIILIISIFIIYGIVRSNFQIENLFFSIGLSQKMLSTIIPWILLAIAAIIVWKFSFGTLFMFIGMIFMGVAGLDLVAARGAVAMVGAGLFLIGLIFYRRKAGKMKINENSRTFRAGKALGKGIAATGHYGWKGTKAIGRGMKKGYKYGTDPRVRLDSYRNKQDRIDSKLALKKEKQLAKKQEKSLGKNLGRKQILYQGMKNAADKKEIKREQKRLELERIAKEKVEVVRQEEAREEQEKILKTQIKGEEKRAEAEKKELKRAETKNKLAKMNAEEDQVKKLARKMDKNINALIKAVENSNSKRENIILQGINQIYNPANFSFPKSQKDVRKMKETIDYQYNKAKKK